MSPPRIKKCIFYFSVKCVNHYTLEPSNPISNPLWNFLQDIWISSCYKAMNLALFLVSRLLVFSWFIICCVGKTFWSQWWDELAEPTWDTLFCFSAAVKSRQERGEDTQQRVKGRIQTGAAAFQPQGIWAKLEPKIEILLSKEKNLYNIGLLFLRPHLSVNWLVLGWAFGPRAAQMGGGAVSPADLSPG